MLIFRLKLLKKSNPNINFQLSYHKATNSCQHIATASFKKKKSLHYGIFLKQFWSMKLILKASTVWLKVILSILFGDILGCFLGEIVFTLLQL